MANSRIYQAINYTANGGITLGGLTSVITTPGIKNVIETEPDGTAGNTSDFVGQELLVSLTSTDILKMFDILNGTPAANNFYVKESGQSTATKVTLANAVVMMSLGFSVNKQGYAQFTMSGRVRFSDGATLSDMEDFQRGENMPTIIYPERLYRVRNVIFTPNGGSPIEINHVDDLRFDINHRPLDDENDDDTGTEAVDRAEKRSVPVSVTSKDFKEQSSDSLATTLLAAAKGSLVFSLLGSGGAVNKQMTIKNMKFTRVPQRHDQNYSANSLSAVAGWHDRTPGNLIEYTLTGANALIPIV